MLKERGDTIMAWKEITPEFKVFSEKGEFVEGKLLGHSEIKIKDVTVKKWSMEDIHTGVSINFLGGVSLDPMLLAVPVGTVIKLEFDGTVKLERGQRVKKFKLYLQSDEPEKTGKRK